MNSTSPQKIINLESESFSLSGKQVNDHDWFEFDTRIGGREFKDIGGEDRTIFLKRLREILTKPRGTPLSETKNAPYKQQVGGDDAEYIGYIAVSGYNTFYFFKSGGYLKHVVFADSNGKLLAHSELQRGFCSSWLGVLSGL